MTRRAAPKALDLRPGWTAKQVAILGTMSDPDAAVPKVLDHGDDCPPVTR